MNKGTSLEAGQTVPLRAFASQAWTGPSEPARLLPASAYHSLSFQAMEDAAIWTRSWICAGFAADVTQGGDILPFTAGNHGIHIERLAGGAVTARFNKAQHGGCRSVPVQCQTGTKTRCSFTACGYSRDRRPILFDDPGRLAQLDQYLGLRPERLLPVPVQIWGPLILVCLDPAGPPVLDWPGAASILGSAGDDSTKETHWVEYDANWKHLAVALAGDEPADRERSTVLFPNVVILFTADGPCVIVLQPTGLTKTLCRIRFSAKPGAESRPDWPNRVLDLVAARAANAEAIHSSPGMSGPDGTAPGPVHSKRIWFDSKVLTAVDSLDKTSRAATAYRTDYKEEW